MRVAIVATLGSVSGWGPRFWRKVVEICNWVMSPNKCFAIFEWRWGLSGSYEFWVWVISFENWVMKTEIPLNQTGPNCV